MFAVTIPDALAAAVIAPSIASTVGLLAWVVRELSRISGCLGRFEQRAEDLDRRVSNLEEYRPRRGW